MLHSTTGQRDWLCCAASSGVTPAEFGSHERRASRMTNGRISDCSAAARAVVKGRARRAHCIIIVSKKSVGQSWRRRRHRGGKVGGQSPHGFSGA